MKLMQMKSFSTSLLLVLFTLSFLGCHLFESTQVSTKEIEMASSWTEKDQAPTFSACEGIENPDEQRACFESIISNSIKDYIAQNPWESSEYLEEEISLLLRIDKDGNFSLEEVVRSNALDSAIPNLVDQLQLAVNQLPQAQPAVKTNVGAFVSTGLTLPIMIIAE
jgi:hypothetical protein